MTSRLGKALLALTVGLMLLMGSTAYAANPAAEDTGGETSACGTTTTDRATHYLPVERWSESTTNFHFRLDADGWNDLAEKIQRNGRDASFMQIGNASWRLSSDALYASSTFCPIRSLGYPLDSLVGTVGKALTATGLLTILAVATIGVAVLNLRKGHGGLYVAKETLKAGVVMGLMTTMMLGAAASTKDGPGTGSPWWWVNQTNTVVNSVSSTLASTTVDSSQNILGYQPLSSDTGTADDWPVTCTTTEDSKGYIDWLHEQYNASYDHDGSADAKAASLSEMVSTMWEAGVLPVWASAQFGSSNPYSDHVYCFFLEARSYSTVSSNEDLKAYLAEQLDWSEETTAKWGENTRAQNTSGGNREDHSLIAWGACIPAGDGGEGATPRGDWKDAIDRLVIPEDCGNWWMGGGDLDKSTLDWDENSVGKYAGSSAGVYNYAASVHGKNGTQVGGIMFAYLIGSLISGAILLLLALLQLGSKLVVAFMVAGVFFALARSLAPGDDWRLFRRTGLQLLGACFVSSCASLMIAIIMMVAGVITKVGAETFSPGTTGAVLATCLGPAAGVFLLHWIFVSVLHVPSPFSFKGAMAWGQGITSGVIGGAVGAGMTGLASNARETTKKMRGSSMRPRPGDGRRKPGAIDPSKAVKGTNRHVFTERSATESLRAGNRRASNSQAGNGGKQLLDEARTERKDRRQNVEKEAKRLAKADGHLGDDDAWKGYKAKARSNLRRARSKEIRESFGQAVRTTPGRAWHGIGEKAKGMGARTAEGARYTAARAGQGLDAAHALAGWAAHHPTRAAAAAGAAGWRTAAAGAKKAVSEGNGALRNMPAKKAVIAGTGAALATGAVPVAAGLMATATGAGWARQHARAISAARVRPPVGSPDPVPGPPVEADPTGMTRDPADSYPAPPVADDPVPGSPLAPPPWGSADPSGAPTLEVPVTPDTAPEPPVEPDPVPAPPSQPAPEPQPGAGERRMQRVDELTGDVGTRPVSEPARQPGDALARETLKRMRENVASERRNNIS